MSYVLCNYVCFKVGQNHIYGNFGREFTYHTFIYGANIRFWPITRCVLKQVYAIQLCTPYHVYNMHTCTWYRETCVCYAKMNIALWGTYAVQACTLCHEAHRLCKHVHCVVKHIGCASMYIVSWNTYAVQACILYVHNRGCASMYIVSWNMLCKHVYYMWITEAVQACTLCREAHVYARVRCG